ncbi:MAG: regulatory signaling modulator protein AmpE [Pseudomonadales bacterium]|nr:regulatory signaling modulator protein AmpE [Pseudomonadales bacterium]
MKLIVLMMAIVAKKFNIVPVWLSDDSRWNPYFERIQQFGFWDMASSPMRTCLIYAPVVALVGLLNGFLGDVLLGLFGIIIAVVVLLFSFGTRDLNDELGEYLLFWRANNKDHYRAVAKKYFSLGSWAVDDEEMHRAVFGEVLQRSCFYLFTPIFWFLVLGPMGAMICGMCALIVRQGENEQVDVSVFSSELVQSSQELQEILAWLPARIMALSFSIIGRFSTVITSALQSFVATERATYDVLNDCASDALSLLPLVEDKEVMREQAEMQMIGLQSLLSRTLGLWLLGVAVFSIFGFGS